MARCRRSNPRASPDDYARKRASLGRLVRVRSGSCAGLGEAPSSKPGAARLRRRRYHAERKASAIGARTIRLAAAHYPTTARMARPSDQQRGHKSRQRSPLPILTFRHARTPTTAPVARNANTAGTVTRIR